MLLCSISCSQFLRDDRSHACFGELFLLSYFYFFHDVKLIGALQGVQFHDFGASKHVVALQIEPGVETKGNGGFPKIVL